MSGNYYIDQRMSTTEIAKQSEAIFGFKVSPASVYNSLIKSGVQLRSKSESVSMATATLDYSQTFMSEDIIEWTDGFLLGDGLVNLSGRSKNKFMSARFSIDSSQKEWTTYAMSKFISYRPSEPKTYNQINEKTPNPIWQSRTLTHPDIVSQAKRWYPDGKKHVPIDVRITPTSLMLWYLGDGSFCNHGESNGSSLRFATCGFLPEENETILMPKLKALGLSCHRCQNKNDIIIDAACTYRFFDIIGCESPIDCYKHKFEIPEWLNYLRLSQICKTPQEHWHINYMIRQGKFQVEKWSPGGRMMLFTESQAQIIRTYLGQLAPNSVV